MPPRSDVRDRLFDAALRRFEADGGAHATLDAIRVEAGASVGSLYHHFSDRRELATELYVDCLERYEPDARAALLDATPRDGVQGLVRAHLRWSAANRARARFLLDGRGVADERAVRERSRPFLADAVRWYRGHARAGRLRKLPFELAYAVWLGPADAYLRQWLPEQRRRIPPTAAEALAAAAWHALEEPT